MRKKDLEFRVKELEEWVRNISCIQNSLLKELGYKIKWRDTHVPIAWVEKVDMESDKGA